MDAKLEAGEHQRRTERGGIAHRRGASQFNNFITDRLLAGAMDAMERAGATAEQIEVVRVPGSLEIPVAAKKLARPGDTIRSLHRMRAARRNVALRRGGVGNRARRAARATRYRRAA